MTTPTTTQMPFANHLTLMQVWTITDAINARQDPYKSGRIRRYGVSNHQLDLFFQRNPDLKPK